MALNIKNRNVEQLANEVSRLTGESKTEAIRKALEERKARLELKGHGKASLEGVMALMEERIWSRLPDEERGKPFSQQEQDDILGYGSEGF